MANEVKNNGTATATAAQDPINQLDAIKNIIFGQEMEQLNSNLKEIDKTQNSRISKLEDRLSDMEASVESELKSLKATLLSEMSTRMDSMQADLDQLNEQKADRQQLGELLVKMGEQLMKG